jgi:hypothetical protein
MFSLPQGPDSEGRTEQNPIVLSGCTNAEFECLLEAIMMPRSALKDLIEVELILTNSHGSTHSVLKNDLLKEQWISVLKLATMWDMPEVCIILGCRWQGR